MNRQLQKAGWLETHVASTKITNDIATTERIKSNLDVLKLLANNGLNAALSQEILSRYSGWSAKVL